MITNETDDISFAFTAFFMKLVGFWMSANRNEQRRRNIALSYTIGMTLFGIYVLVTDLYHAKNHIGDLLYTMTNMLSLMMSLMKISIMFAQRKKFFKLVLHLQRRFLTVQADYNSYEKSIVEACKRSCTICTVLFTSFTLATVFSYIITPAIENIGKNESDRVLPFNMWIDLPMAMSPYYEILYFIEVLAVYQIGVCYFCFDNFLFMMNKHAATQFRILRHRLSNIESTNKEKHDQKKYLLSSSEKSYVNFRNYVQQHQALIAYCDELEEVYNLLVLGQVLMFSLLICLDGCQVLLANANGQKRFIFMFHLVACVSQLLMFTYGCDGLIHESGNVGRGAYESPWPHLTMDKYGTTMRKDLLFVLARSQVPCCLTAKGFFPVSLGTYTSVLSTAVSYFTLLKQTMEDADGM